VRTLKVTGWHSTVTLVVAGLVLILFLLLIGFWDNGYQKHLAQMAPDKAVAEEDEYDYNEDGELVKVEKPAPRFPVPPLDLPHYHGLELGGTALAGSVPSTTASGDGVTKEVTGA
jgi:hypothetical protein